MLCILLAAAHEGPQRSYNAHQFLLHLFVHPLGVSWAEGRAGLRRRNSSQWQSSKARRPGNDSGSTPRIVAGCLIEPVVGMRASPPNPRRNAASEKDQERIMMSGREMLLPIRKHQNLRKSCTRPCCSEGGV